MPMWNEWIGNTRNKFKVTFPLPWLISLEVLLAVFQLRCECLSTVWAQCFNQMGSKNTSLCRNKFIYKSADQKLQVETCQMIIDKKMLTCFPVLCLHFKKTTKIYRIMVRAQCGRFLVIKRRILLEQIHLHKKIIEYEARKAESQISVLWSCNVTVEII